MRLKTLLCALMAVATFSDFAYACELAPGLRAGVLSDVRPGMPNREAVRVVAVVLGYGSPTPVGGRLLNVEHVATLRVRVQDVISGKTGKSEAEVALLGVTDSCSSVGTSRELLERSYPVGATIVVFGEAVPVFTVPATRAIVAASNQGGFVEAVPRNVRKTATGELDFRRSDPEVSGNFLRFEFDRALLALANAPRRERFARLLNLADYPYSFHAFRDADRQFYSRLISENGITGPEARQLLDRFDEDDGR